MIKSITNKHILMKNSVNCICTEIKSAQRKYQIALHCKIEYLSILMDHFVFISLEKKITHSALAMISYKLNFAKINIEKFNYQMFFEDGTGHTAIIEPLGDCYISKCKLFIWFSLPCKCWLYQYIID